jgi:hypothetical protein
MSLPKDSPQKKLVTEVAELLHSDKLFEAAKHFLAATGVRDTVDTREKAYEVLTRLLHWLLGEGHPEEAAQLLWSPTLFSAEPEATKRVWRAFDTQNFILLMGAASMSKSYSMGVRLMLEWITDPEHTTVQVIGPSENHLEDNLFSHLVALHRNSAIPLPGECKKLFIGLDSKQRKGAIRGVVVPLGKKGAGRIQGTKRVPRIKPHPKYGPLSRMFIFLDEMVNIPKGIWRDIDNVFANAQGDSGMKIIGAFNPTDPQDEVGQRCEPPFGWNEFDPDINFEWMSTRGWWTVRLDAKFSENVQLGVIKFVGLQGLEGYNHIIRNSGGMDSPGYWAMCRGCFPPTGVSLSVIPGGMLNKFKGEFIWFETANDCAGIDLALRGKDAAKFCKGRFGLASGIRLPPSLEHPDGRTIYFKDTRGRNAPRYALQVDTIITFPKGDTVQMAEAVIKLCQQTRVKPDWVCMDRTGNGQGVYDLVRSTWSHQVLAVNYSESPTNRKVMFEDTKLPEDLFDRVQTELWFALRSWLEYDYIKGAFGLDTTSLYPQVSNRWFRATGKKSKVESKEEYEARNQAKSPDEADALTLLVHGVRLTSQVTLGMTPENTTADGYGADDGDDDGYRCDVTNRRDDLDD